MALECVNLIKINGEWVAQKDIPKETFDRIMSEILVRGMENVGYKQKKKTA